MELKQMYNQVKELLSKMSAPSDKYITLVKYRHQLTIDEYFTLLQECNLQYLERRIINREIKIVCGKIVQYT